MKPLSILYYCIKNKRKVISMAIAIGFSVALIYSLQFIIDQILHSNDLTALNPLTHYSEVSGANGQAFSKDIYNQIIHNESTDRVFPVFKQETFYISAVGGMYAVGVFSMNHEEMRFFLERLDLKLVKGRLPKDGTAETVMDYYLAKNKGLKIGDKIGYTTDKKERNLMDSYTIVGLLKGESISMVIPENIGTNTLSPNEILVFHKAGRLDQSNVFLQRLPQKNVNVKTYQSVLATMNKDSEDIKKYMNILVVMLIIVLSISTGNASYINIFQRRYEFGLLNSVGYSPLFILKKASIEIFIMNVTGYCAGILITLIMAGIQYVFLFEPNGLIMRLIQPSALLQTLSIPVFTSLFSIIPVSWMLKKIDPICIIEGVE